jgi:FkbM family methyltransferase
MTIQPDRRHLDQYSCRTRWLALSLLRPYLRNHWMDKGKWFLMRRLNPNVGMEDGWKRYGTRVARSRYGFRMHLDPVYAAHRLIYFTGEYEPVVSRLVASTIGRGWRFIDVGANVGFYSLLGATLADEVVSIEPNPATREQLARNIELNDMDRINVLPIALADTDGALTLYQQGIDSGGANLLRRPLSMAREYRVDVRRGDDVIPPTSLPNTFLKLDTEGYEHQVARGCEKLLRDHRCVVLSEVTDQWLRQSGTSAGAYFDFMRGLGYTPYLVDHPRTALRTRPQLTRLERPREEFQYDVLFRRDEELHIPGDSVVTA